MKKLSLFFILVSSITVLYASEIKNFSKTEGVLTSDQLSYFQNLFDLQTFIETGTYAGDTTAEAAKVFIEVHSIEIFRPLYEKAQERFNNYPNVILYLGDTTELLHQVIENSLPKRLYWLDAHSSGGGTGGVPGFSPILHELDQILSQKEDIHSVILIDDLRGLCHCDERTNLPLRLIIQKIKEIDCDLEFYSIGDVGIIFNKDSHPFISVSEIVKQASISRFFIPDCDNESLLEELVNAESFIASYKEDSLECISFHQLTNWVNRECLGGEVIYLLWEALRELENSDYPSAIHDLQLITNSFYSHWRIQAYLVKALILDGQLDKATSMFNENLLKAYAQYPRIIKKIINIDSFLDQESH